TGRRSARSNSLTKSTTGTDAGDVRQAADSEMMQNKIHNGYRAIALGLILVFLTSVGRFYHPGTGFTAFIGFPEGHDSEAPAIRDIPHYQYPAWASYDGQFYAQRALDP